MFGKKDKNKISEEVVKNTQVIPDDFYGGRDPVIHYANEKVLSKNKNGLAEKKFKIKSADSGGVFGVVKNFFSHKVVLYSVLGVLFVAFVSGVTWYYLYDAGFIGGVVTTVPDTTEKTIPPLVMENATDIIGDVPSGVVVDSIEDMFVEFDTSTQADVIDMVSEIVPLSLEERPIDFPRIILTDSVDIDSDSLTDMEEEIFTTDSGVWDTDNDAYYDGQEVTNMYNPKGIAPVKLIDSGLIREYVNPIWKYRIYYPIVWEQGTVDTESRQVLFSAITGDYVEVSVYQIKTEENFENWFARKATGEKYTDLSIATNPFKEESYKRRDGLVYYFVRNNNVYVLIYHPGVTGFIPFRSTMQLMANSFRPSSTVIELPDQVVLPAVPDYSLLETGNNIVTSSKENESVDFVDEI